MTWNDLKGLRMTQNDLKKLSMTKKDLKWLKSWRYITKKEKCDGLTDGRADGPTDRRTDIPSYRDAWTHLKKNTQKDSRWKSRTISSLTPDRHRFFFLVFFRHHLFSLCVSAKRLLFIAIRLLLRSSPYRAPGVCSPTAKSNSTPSDWCFAPLFASVWTSPE